MKRSVLLLAGVLGCTPSFEDTPWRVEETRVLGIVSDPPEARPGEVVQLSALVGSPDGTVSAAPSWDVCTRPRASSERTAVTQRCLEGDALESASATWAVLSDACARFGPNVPPTEDDAAPQRPSDPDASGGYFVPVRAEAADALAFGVVRIRCDLPGVTRAIFEEFEARYTLNRNPEITGVTVDGQEVDADPIVVSAGAATELEVALSDASAEPYVRYDPGEGVLLDEREWLRVEVFVTDGELDRGQVIVRPEDDPGPVSIAWHAPASPTTVSAWVIVTDARGGATWRDVAIRIEP
jgi:hypothetical protein